MAEQLPAPEPFIDPELQPYWEGTSRGVLVLPRCTSCDTWIWYPRSFCPRCGATTVDWTEASGTGSVYSCTVTRRPMGEYRGLEKFVLAYVELDEGPRVLTNVVDCDPESVRVAQRVEAVFHRTAEGHGLLRFRPIEVR